MTGSELEIVCQDSSSSNDDQGGITIFQINLIGLKVRKYPTEAYVDFNYIHIIYWPIKCLFLFVEMLNNIWKVSIVH